MTNIDYKQFEQWGRTAPDVADFGELLRLIQQDRTLATVALRAVKAELAASNDPTERERRGTEPPA